MPHECSQLESIGALKEAADSLKGAIERLDKRCNGTFNTIGEHIKESPVYRGQIEVLRTEINILKEEKNNSIKASQWRIGLIVGAMIGILNVVVGIGLKILK